MQILILCGIYAVELFCYQLGLRILFEVRLKTKVWMFVGLVLPVLIGVMAVDASGKNVLVSLVVIAVTFLTVEGRVLEKGVRIILTLLLLMCVEEVFAYICKEFVVFQSAYRININYLKIKCCAGIGTLLLNQIKLKIVKNEKIHINSMIYFVLGIITFSMMLCLGALNYTKVYLHDVGFKTFCNVLDAVIYICIFLLIVFVFRVP